MSGETKTFNIEVTMEERWIDDFCSFLKKMEYYGNIGHSSIIGFYTDGDGDFHPKFNIDTKFETKTGNVVDMAQKQLVFDAG